MVFSLLRMKGWPILRAIEGKANPIIIQFETVKREEIISFLFWFPVEHDKFPEIKRMELTASKMKKMTM